MTTYTVEAFKSNKSRPKSEANQQPYIYALDVKIDLLAIEYIWIPPNNTIVWYCSVKRKQLTLPSVLYIPQCKVLAELKPTTGHSYCSQRVSVIPGPCRRDPNTPVGFCLITNTINTEPGRDLLGMLIIADPTKSSVSPLHVLFPPTSSHAVSSLSAAVVMVGSAVNSGISCCDCYISSVGETTRDTLRCDPHPPHPSFPKAIFSTSTVCSHTPASSTSGDAGGTCQTWMPVPSSLSDSSCQLLICLSPFCLGFEMLSRCSHATAP